MLVPMKRKLLLLLAAGCVMLMLVACAAKTPQEKLVEALNDAIERVDEATTRKKLDCTSQRLILDYKAIFKNMTPAEQNRVMNSKEVIELQNMFNKKFTDKLKVVR